MKNFANKNWCAPLASCMKMCIAGLLIAGFCHAAVANDCKDDTNASVNKIINSKKILLATFNGMFKGQNIRNIPDQVTGDITLFNTPWSFILTATEGPGQAEYYSLRMNSNSSTIIGNLIIQQVVQQGTSGSTPYFSEITNLTPFRVTSNYSAVTNCSSSLD